MLSAVGSHRADKLCTGGFVFVLQVLPCSGREKKTKKNQNVWQGVLSMDSLVVQSCSWKGACFSSGVADLGQR